MLSAETLPKKRTREERDAIELAAARRIELRHDAERANWLDYLSKNDPDNFGFFAAKLLKKTLGGSA